MTISVRFMSLTGKFTCVREETFANEAAALVAIKAHAEGAGFTNVQTVADDDPTSIRFTARTPGGRGGRNVAFGDLCDPQDGAPVAHHPTIVEARGPVIRYFVYTVDGCSDYATEDEGMNDMRSKLARQSWREPYEWVAVVKKQSDGKVFQPVDSVTYRRTGRGDEIEGTRP